MLRSVTVIVESSPNESIQRENSFFREYEAFSRKYLTEYFFTV